MLGFFTDGSVKEDPYTKTRSNHQNGSLNAHKHATTLDEAEAWFLLRMKADLTFAGRGGGGEEERRTMRCWLRVESQAVHFVVSGRRMLDVGC